MALRDRIRCEVPLPDGGRTDTLFITDDFGRDLSEHAIKADGLYFDCGPIGTPLKASAPGVKPESIFGILGAYEPNLVRLPDYSGHISFRDCEGGVRREYRATFVDGKLTQIEVVPAKA